MVHLTGLSSIIGAINFIATIHNMRAPGMGWGRMPLFVWTILIYAYLIIVALTSLAATVTMLLLDRNFGTHFFDPAQGGSALLWQHLFWFFGHPEVYILVLPAFGVFSEILPVFARKPIFGYKAIAAATAGIAFLGMLVWAHHMFATPMSHRRARVLHALELHHRRADGREDLQLDRHAVARHGRVDDVPLLYCVGGIATFTMGGITGIFLAVFPIDWQLTDTYFVVAHFHYTAFGASRLRDARGAVLLVPEDDGPDAEREPRQGRLRADVHRLPPDVPDPALGRPVAACRGASTSTRDTSWTAYNFISTVGAFMIALSVLRDGHQRRAARSRRARSPARTRGRRTRSSGSRPRRRRRTTST